MSGDASPVRAGESMLLGNGQQLRLLDVDEFGIPGAIYAESEDRGRFTGERLFLTNPRLYNAIARLLTRGNESYRDIAEVAGVSLNTVCGVAWREKIPIETMRQRIATRGMTLALLTQEAALELLSDPDWRKNASAKDLLIMHGIAFTNAQLAAGGATARIETADATPPDHAAYLAFIAAQRKPAERNVTPPPTGLEAGTPPTKDATPGAPGGPALDVPTEPPKSTSE